MAEDPSSFCSVTFVDWRQDTHLLVDFFEEERTSLIPIKRVKKKDNLAVGDECGVTWADNKVYTGTVICSGSMEKCAAMQEELEESESDTESDKQELLNKVMDNQALKERQDLGTKQKSQKKIRKKDKIDGKENIDTQKKSTVSKSSKRKSTSTDEPKPKKKKSDFELWIGHVPSASESVDDSMPSQVTNKKLQYEHLFGEIGVVKELVQDIRKYQDVEFKELKKKLEEISSNTTSILATAVAKKLSPAFTTKDLLQSTPTHQSENLTEALGHGYNENSFNASAEAFDDNIYEAQRSTVSQACTEVEIDDTLEEIGSVEEIVPVEEVVPELIPSSELTPIFVRSCSRRNFATRIVRHLIDRETRMCSNVHGRGKERLDPQVVKYAKVKCFEYFPCPASSIKDEWSLCVISIDESCRRLKKQRKM